jgi:hypothetical protein
MSWPPLAPLHHPVGPWLKVTTLRDDGREMPPMLQPPVTGMPPEVWIWLRESLAVRPKVVADVRARLDAGERPAPEDVALAMLPDVWRHRMHGARGDGADPSWQS